MAERLKIDTDVHELKLGKSFDSRNKVAFHSIRYDFKPESLDSTKSSTVTVGDNNSVTVSVPHVQSSGTSHTVFKGNKRPVQKECVLVINHDTGEFTLEKLSNAIQLKKTRMDSTEVTDSLNARSSPSAALPSNKHCHRNQQKKTKKSLLLSNSYKDDTNDDVFKTNNDGDSSKSECEWSPSNSVAMDTLSDEELDTGTSRMLMPSLGHVYNEFENRLTCSFMKKSSAAENKPPKILSRVTGPFRLSRRRGNSEEEPIEIDSESSEPDSDDFLPDLPEAEEEEMEETPSELGIVEFAEKRKRDIDHFLSEHKLETQRRPFARSLAQMDQFEQKHPELYAKMKARLRVPDDELYALNDYLCDEYCEQLRGNGPAFLMMQKLEDLVDFVVKLYQS